MNKNNAPQKVSQSEIIDFINTEFPQSKCIIDAVGRKSATIRHNITEAELRPGGTVSGPVMMFVADVALYVAILGEIGIVPLTVTKREKPSRSATCTRIR